MLFLKGHSTNFTHKGQFTSHVGLGDYIFTTEILHHRLEVRGFKDVGVYQTEKVKQNDAISFIMGNVGIQWFWSFRHLCCFNLFTGVPLHRTNPWLVLSNLLHLPSFYIAFIPCRQPLVHIISNTASKITCSEYFCTLCWSYIMCGNAVVRKDWIKDSIMVHSRMLIYLTSKSRLPSKTF